MAQQITGRESPAWQGEKLTRWWMRLIEAVAPQLHLDYEPSVLEAALEQIPTATGDLAVDLPAMSKFLSWKGPVVFSPMELNGEQIWQMASDQFPVAVPASIDNGSAQWHEGPWWILLRVVGGRLEGVRLEAGEVKTCTWSIRQWRRIWGRQTGRVGLVMRRAALESAGGDRLHDHRHHGGHDSHGAHGGHVAHGSISPLRRLGSILKLERSDLLSLILFGVVAGILQLATPLAVEWTVTTVAFGRYLQPLLILAGMLFVLLLFAGVMRLLQFTVIEMMQRRVMIRIVGDLVRRIPMAPTEAWNGVYGPELLNRFFDVPTIQKSFATVLLDGINLVLSTVIGLTLLAFYHPFLLGFDIVLVLCLTIITYLLGRGAVRTATAESISKYELGHWLQNLAKIPATFQGEEAAQLAKGRAHQAMLQYLVARRSHFILLLRQMFFSVGLQAVASTVLLGLGGYLVMIGQLTLGQLVASELVVTAIVSAFAKVGKTLETFYDLLVSVDKVGHLLDIPAPMAPMAGGLPTGPAEAAWSDLASSRPGVDVSWEAGYVAASQRVVLRGRDIESSSALLRWLAGRGSPDHGELFVDRWGVRELARCGSASGIAYVGQPEIFQGSLLENLRVGSSNATLAQLRDAILAVGLDETIAAMPQGLESRLLMGGDPLTSEQLQRLMLARAIATQPRLLLIDHALDRISASSRKSLWQWLAHPDRPWTLIVATQDGWLTEQGDGVAMGVGAGKPKGFLDSQEDGHEQTR
jgi:putative ABC transport system ATP-binding protein